jgi:hypothetical protein
VANWLMTGTADVRRPKSVTGSGLRKVKSRVASLYGKWKVICTSHDRMQIKDLLK